MHFSMYKINQIITLVADKENNFYPKRVLYSIKMFLSTSIDVNDVSIFTKYSTKT